LVVATFNRKELDLNLFRKMARTLRLLHLMTMFVALSWTEVAQALPKPPHSNSPPVTDVAATLGALASQRPWTCPDQDTDGASQTPWRSAPVECAWQNRLRMRRWHGPAATQTGACVSAEAVWWTRARLQATAPPAAASAWRSSWTSQAIRDEIGAEQRVIIMRRNDEGQWSATEWRWKPSERADTRRWQAARWALLVAHAARHGPTAAPPGREVRDSSPLWGVLEANLGRRPGEIAGGVLSWASDGMCLQVDRAAPGPQQLQLSYTMDDSRQEQRAAMQLQLARRFPEATWLTPFSLVPAPEQLHRGAKFYAIWLEGAVLSGQLWMPTRGDGPLQRLRISTRLAPQSPPAGISAGKRAIERELLALAASWTHRHD
jgi:hypothetical protein